MRTTGSRTKETIVRLLHFSLFGVASIGNIVRMAIGWNLGSTLLETQNEDTARDALNGIAFRVLAGFEARW